MMDIEKLLEETPVESIPEDTIVGMWEASKEEQAEIDDIIADLGIEL